MIIQLHYCNTNTYLIKGTNGCVLFDTGWAGTFPAFCKELDKHHISIRDIRYIMISHFHPDHMGIAQNIAQHGATILVFDTQKEYVHWPDTIFQKDTKVTFTPIDDRQVKAVSIPEGRNILYELGIRGEIIATPGHSDDSISLMLDDGELFVGDLNPLYELELHEGTVIHDSWDKLLSLKPKKIFYGHAKTAELTNAKSNSEETDRELYRLVKQIMKYIDRGKTLEVIHNKTGAGKDFIEDVARMYLTHQNVGVQGILDRIEIKGK